MARIKHAMAGAGRDQGGLRARRWHVADPLAASNGWYDLSVTTGSDDSWSRRYTGHLELSPS